VLSTAKLLYYLFDFAAGYACKVWPARRRGRVIIFDRYYADLLIDPQRYRQGPALVSARAVGALIPQPDLMIILDAPAAVLQARKQEVSFNESERVRKGYLSLARSTSRAHVVDASRPADQVFEDVRRLVEGRLADRRTSASQLP
jgi:thymidylate kinase